jgi:uncharacterized alpha-E superfamily protein
MTASEPPFFRPQATVMLSRVAHSLYWMSRYIERAENIARLLDVNLQFVSDLPDARASSPTSGRPCCSAPAGASSSASSTARPAARR